MRGSWPASSLAKGVIEKGAAKGVKIVTAESCTGGLIAAALTDTPGASTVFDRAFVTYSNEAKRQMLGVDQALLHRYGAVSSAVARAMAAGALVNSDASLSVSVTGVAGPGGGTSDKPVGLVWFAVAARGKRAVAERRLFASGSREFIRMKATETALRLLYAAI